MPSDPQAIQSIPHLQVFGVHSIGIQICLGLKFSVEHDITRVIYGAVVHTHLQVQQAIYFTL